MSLSRPAVHPVEITSLGPAAAINNHNQNNGEVLLPPQRVRMRDVQGMPGTTGGLFLRFLQFATAVASICVMVTTPDFKSVTAFCYLVAAATLQSLWSLVLAVVDIYALLVKRSLKINLWPACSPLVMG